MDVRREAWLFDNGDAIAEDNLGLSLEYIDTHSNFTTDKRSRRNPAYRDCILTHI